jgi:hypothetical protein
VVVAFGQVAQVELDPAVAHVFDREVEPEEVSSGVGVYPEEKVVLVGVHLYNAVKVTSFKPRLKNQLVSCLQRGIHAFKGSIVDLISVELVVVHRVLC